MNEVLQTALKKKESVHRNISAHSRACACVCLHTRVHTHTQNTYVCRDFSLCKVARMVTAIESFFTVNILLRHNGLERPSPLYPD